MLEPRGTLVPWGWQLDSLLLEAHPRVCPGPIRESAAGPMMMAPVCGPAQSDLWRAILPLPVSEAAEAEGRGMQIPVHIPLASCNTEPEEAYCKLPLVNGT